MQMSKLWRNRGLLLRWGMFFLLLAAVGVVQVALLAPEPRWLRTEEPMAVFDAGAGQIVMHRFGNAEATGSLRVLDAATGADVGRFLTDADTYRSYGHSDDGRYFVGIARGSMPDTRRIDGVDVKEAREWHAQARVSHFRSPLFSPGCDFVAVHLVSLLAALEPDPPEDKAESYALIETATGTVVSRVRLPMSAEHLSFSANGGCLVFGYQDEEDTYHIRAVSTRTGTASTFDDARVLAVAPDGRSLIADRGEEGIWVADLATTSWRCPLEGVQPRDRDLNRRKMLYLRSVYLAHELQARSVRYRGAAKLWTVPNRRIHIRAHRSEDPVFSPDSRSVLWPAAPKSGLILYDIDTGQRRWQETPANAVSDPLFTPDGRWIVVARRDPDRALVLSAATGATAHTISLTGLAEFEPQLTRDGRTVIVTATPVEEEPHWLWTKVHTWLPERPETAPMLIRAFDLETGRALGELAVEETNELWLTEDRRSLITVHQHHDDSGAVATTIRCWDMPPQKPLRWLALVLPAVALALLSLRFAWRRLRRRRATAAEPPQAAGDSGNRDLIGPTWNWGRSGLW
jgi:hypothetical protein